MPAFSTPTGSDNQMTAGILSEPAKPTSALSTAMEMALVGPLMDQMLRRIEQGADYRLYHGARF